VSADPLHRSSADFSVALPGSLVSVKQNPEVGVGNHFLGHGELFLEYPYYRTIITAFR